MQRRVWRREARREGCRQGRARRASADGGAAARWRRWPKRSHVASSPPPPPPLIMASSSAPAAAAAAPPPADAPIDALLFVARECFVYKVCVRGESRGAGGGLRRSSAGHLLDWPAQLDECKSASTAQRSSYTSSAEPSAASRRQLRVGAHACRPTLQSRRGSSVMSLLLVRPVQPLLHGMGSYLRCCLDLRPARRSAVRQPHADTSHQATTCLAGWLQGGRVGRHGGASHFSTRAAADAHMLHRQAFLWKGRLRIVEHGSACSIRLEDGDSGAPRPVPVHSTAADACCTQASSLRARRTRQTARPSSPCSTRAATLCCVCRARMDGAHLWAWA